MDTHSEPPLGQDDDQNLLQRLRQGDPKALEEVVARYGRQIERLSHRLMGWSGDAADVAQDVLARLIECRLTIRAENGLGPWLYAVTVNECRAWRRRWRVRWRLLERIGNEIHPVTSAADSSPQRDEINLRVRAAVAALPIRLREVIVLYYLEQTPVEEIGKILGSSRNAVEVRLHRARASLKEKLKGFAEF